MQRLLVILASVISVSGCAGSTLTGSGHAASQASSSSEVPTSTSSTVPPPTAPVTSTSTTTPPPTPAQTDITHISYTRPKGFVLVTNYHPVTPLEAQYTTRYFVPQHARNGLDVLSLVLYRLPRAGLATTSAQQLSRVAKYNRKSNARVLDGPTATRVGGRSAFEVTAIEEGTYKYVAFYVFGTKHVLLVTCQVDKYPTVISQGCQHLVESIDLS